MSIKIASMKEVENEINNKKLGEDENALENRLKIHVALKLTYW